MMKSAAIGFDLQDWTQYFSYHAVSNCDVIFKRAYDPLLVNEYEKKLPMRIVPMGPNHSCAVTDHRVLRKIEQSKRKQMLAKGLSEPHRIRQVLLGKIRPQARPAEVKKFENTLSTPSRSDYVFFKLNATVGSRMHTRVV